MTSDERLYELIDIGKKYFLNYLDGYYRDMRHLFSSISDNDKLSTEDAIHLGFAIGSYYHKYGIPYANERKQKSSYRFALLCDKVREQLKELDRDRRMREAEAKFVKAIMEM